MGFPRLNEAKMRALCCPLFLTVVLLAAPASMGAQASIEITVKVPLNLTQLSPDLQKVRVSCTIQTGAIPGGAASQTQDLPVSGGQVVTTAILVFPLTNLDLSTTWGRNARAVCSIQGYSTATGWRGFSGPNALLPVRTNLALNTQSLTFVF